MRDLRICFVGDSYINGSGDEQCLGWIGRLCKARFNRQFRLTFYDLGIRGATTDEIRGRWVAECAARFPDGADNRVVLQFGINDVAEIVGSGRRVEEEASVANAEAIAREAASRYPTLWVGVPPANVACSPMRPSEGLEIDFSQETAIALNRRYAELAAKLGVPYLDIQTPLLADKRYMDSLTKGDRMHCDGSGYAIMADLVDKWDAWADWF
ncbi:GDSL-type esterase/lipase family protein [Hoeflea poritis]|uniref:GDSL-type esterase/lipase family protein n=1 Tax=Hoeflea poritis TaxID=2993659 RepID=A0ABT4VQL9_9HYPH|nr:GDSL-type esterase/lipase family protein [Hoeflea poritis]MDA4847007.1 GDSL-type esterase/lipase family protein [Hoeflea poritis]